MKSIKKNNRAVSPVVATILLIAIVVVIALIVFLWLRNLSKEVVQKFDENVELTCEKVKFEADYFPDDGILSLSNNGNIAIKDFVIKKVRGGESESIKASEIDNYFSGSDKGLTIGLAKDLFIDVENYERLLIIPVLLANSNSGQIEYICDEKDGVEIDVR